MARFSSEPAAASPECSIHSEPVRAVLDRLHAESGQQTLRLVGLGAALARDKLLGRTDSLPQEVERLRDLYVPVSKKQGELLYLIARSLGDVPEGVEVRR